MHKYESSNPVEATITESSPNRIVLVSTFKSSKGVHTIQTILKAK